MSGTELQIIPEQPKRRGRPKTVNIDKKEYNKQYREKNREKLLEKDRKYYVENKDKISEYQKEYIENLKINDPEKFKELRQIQSEKGKLYTQRSYQLMNIIKDLLKKELIAIPESHKEIINSLIN